MKNVDGMVLGVFQTLGGGGTRFTQQFIFDYLVSQVGEDEDKEWCNLSEKSKRLMVNDALIRLIRENQIIRTTTKTLGKTLDDEVFEYVGKRVDCYRLRV